MASTTPPPPPAHGSPPSSDSTESVATVGAPVGPRIVARLIDALMMGMAASLLNAALVAPLFRGRSGSGTVATMSGTSTGVAGFVLSVMSLGVTLAYFALFDARMGGTPGKKAVGLRVEASTGGNPTMGESLKRNSWLALSLVPAYGGLVQFAAAIAIIVTISNSPSNLGWHDVFAATRVTRS